MVEQQLTLGSRNVVGENFINNVYVGNMKKLIDPLSFPQEEKDKLSLTVVERTFCIFF